MRCLFMVFSFAMCLTAAHAADIQPGNWSWVLGWRYIDLTGEIKNGDEQKFKNAAATVGKLGIVRLNSSGGYIPAAIAIAQMVYHKGYLTMATRDGKCGSVCPLIWASGQKCIIKQDSVLEFYVPADEKSRQRVIDYYHWLGFGRETIQSPGIESMVKTPNSKLVADKEARGFAKLGYHADSVLGWLSCSSRYCIDLAVSSLLGQ
jgi:hypothetical protein